MQHCQKPKLILWGSGGEARGGGWWDIVIMILNSSMAWTHTASPDGFSSWQVWVKTLTASPDGFYGRQAIVLFFLLVLWSIQCCLQHWDLPVSASLMHLFPLVWLMVTLNGHTKLLSVEHISVACNIGICHGQCRPDAFVWTNRMACHSTPATKRCSCMCSWISLSTKTVLHQEYIRDILYLLCSLDSVQAKSYVLQLWATICTWINTNIINTQYKHNHREFQRKHMQLAVGVQFHTISLWSQSYAASIRIYQQYKHA